MRLSTLVCADPRCDREITGDIAMYHVVTEAVEQGWTFFEYPETTGAYCPLHGPEGSEPTQKWVVGCYTCDWEEGVLDKEEADFAAGDHECEPDTYVWSPEQMNTRAQERAERHASYDLARKEEEAHALLASQLATARAQEIDRYARNWLRIRNTILFWKERKH